MSPTCRTTEAATVGISFLKTIALLSPQGLWGPNPQELFPGAAFSTLGTLY